MGAFQDIRKDIEQRLSANWTSTDIAWDNVDYTPTPETAFIRLLVEEVDSRQVTSQSTPCHRIIGLIHVMIMVSVGTGTDTARGYADGIATIFRNANFSDIQCRSPRIERVGDIGEWFQYSVLVPFYADKSLANAS